MLNKEIVKKVIEISGACAMIKEECRPYKWFLDIDDIISIHIFIPCENRVLLADGEEGYIPSIYHRSITTMEDVENVLQCSKTYDIPESRVMFIMSNGSTRAFDAYLI